MLKETCVVKGFFDRKPIRIGKEISKDVCEQGASVERKRYISNMILF